MLDLVSNLQHISLSIKFGWFLAVIKSIFLNYKFISIYNYYKGNIPFTGWLQLNEVDNFIRGKYN